MFLFYFEVMKPIIVYLVLTEICTSAYSAKRVKAEVQNFNFFLDSEGTFFLTQISHLEVDLGKIFTNNFL